MTTIPPHHRPEIESKPCEECGGSGMVPCGYCQGEVGLEACSDPDGDCETTCYACKGTGQRDEEVAEQREIDRKNEYRNPGD